MTHGEQPKDSKELRKVRLGRADDLKLYEISDHELGQLEQGSPVSVLFNFAAFLTGVFVSTLSLLLSVSFSDGEVWKFVIFVVITVVSGVAAVVCGVVWLRFGQSNRDLVQRIKDRIREEDEIGPGPIVKPGPGPRATEDDSGTSSP